jgi:hypothetical protein
MKPTTKWILGVLGPVLTAVLIYWLTPPRPTPGPALAPAPAPAPTPAPPVPNLTSYPWDGRVIDAAKRSVLSNTAVAIEISGQKYTDSTDDEGRFIFLIPISTQPYIAVVTVLAQGYNEFTRQLTVDATNHLERLTEVELTPMAPTAPPAPAGHPSPKPLLHANVAALAYRPKPQDQAVKVTLPPTLTMRGR